ncbi:ABC transporter permease [Mesoplasma corruscae]|uniref:ABC transporter permease n=1 Tax=Mesoplasma corruscae TaxID=216874 RepID=A0A2S5RGQ4_9MOLU|nr:ABC transporter permease [Mesoplasma corruscae]PPE06516.1 ABC transporter permease [Mesoplasma corruscae]
MGLKKFKHMFKNSYKNATKNKMQLFGVIVLVFFLSLILTTVVSLNNRVISQYSSILKVSRQHDAVIDLNPYDVVATGDSKESKNAPKNLIEAQQYWIQQLQAQYESEKPEWSFDWSRTEAREFAQVQNKNTNITLKALVKTTQSFESNILNSDGVDKLTIFEGKDIETRHQIVIDKNFAKSNDIQIGNIIRIQKDNIGDSLLVKNSNNDENFLKNINTIESELESGIDSENSTYQTLYSNYQWFQVVGFGSSADFVTPIINESTALPNRKTEALIYLHHKAFGLTKNEDNGLYSYEVNANGNLSVNSNTEQESFYSIKFKNKIPSKKDLEEIEIDFRELIKRNINNKLVFAKNDGEYRFSERIRFLNKTILSYSIAASIIFVLTLIVVLYSVALITKKQIEKSAKQLGTLKALGYRKRILVFNFVMLPLFTSLIGGVAGYFGSVLLSNLITLGFSNYFNLNYSAFNIDWISFLTMIGVIWLILNIISFSISISLMRKSALSLISKLQDKKMNGFKKFVKAIRVRRGFGARVRKALLVDALGKMFGIGLVVLLSSSLFTISFIAPNILEENKKYSFNGIKYKQIVEYNDPSYNNPMSFLKTFENKNDPSQLIYGKEAKGWTSLKLTDNGAIDMDQVMSDYYNGHITNDYYSMFIDSYIKNGNVIPSVLDFAFANTKMLNLESVIFDTNYFKEIAKYGIPSIQKNDLIGGLLAPNVLTQWTDYKDLMANIDANDLNTQEDVNKIIIQNAKLMQAFYKKLTSSIGMSITNDFRVGEYGQVTDQKWTEMSNNEKINIFNAESEENEQLKKNYLSNSEDIINKLLKQSSEYDTSFALTNDNWSMGSFRINDIHNQKLSLEDYYVISNFDEAKPDNEADMQKVKDAILQYWKWFTFTSYNRIDQAVIQAGISRPPYFVSQNIASAYQSEDKNYSMAFNLIQYNSKVESLGTKLNASKNGNDFKIYGIQNEDRFLNLFDSKKNDLMSILFNDTSENGIIINQSLAKVLNIKENDEVDFDIIQNELQDASDGENKPFNLDDWDTTGLWSGSNGFKQNSRMQKFANITVKRPVYGDSKAINFLNSINSPTNYYRSVLNGETVVGTKTQNTKFKVLGIHDGYGTSQAWIKNDDANAILKYDIVQNYIWKNIFTRQWNDSFGYSNGLIAGKTDIILEDQINETVKVIPKISGLDLTKNNNWDLDTFKEKFLNSSDKNKKEIGTLIYSIFKNQYPVFNYKYSNSSDIGDFGTSLSISSVYGDYSPTALNGLSAKNSDTGQSFDGTGIGSTSWILPVDTYKEIMDEISIIIVIILALIIVLIVSIAFVIILLTTSIIINDNIQFISTMRVLGYSDKYVVKTVMGMYAIVITIMFVLGYIGGWYACTGIVNVLKNAGLIVPLVHPIWLPFIVFIGVVGIYIVAIYAGYRSITKINSIKVLQDSEL